MLIVWLIIKAYHYVHQDYQQLQKMSFGLSTLQFNLNSLCFCVCACVCACMTNLWPWGVLTTVYIQLHNMVYGCVRSPLQLLNLNLERHRSTINVDTLRAKLRQ